MLPFSSSSTPGIFFVPLSLGPTPDKNNKLPYCRACGYSPTGSGALLDSIFLLVISQNLMLQKYLMISRIAIYKN
jgi:hypothetical protein